MRKRSWVNTLVISALVLAVCGGCAVHIPVRVLKPAQLDIGTNIKKVAVLDFDFRGQWKFWHEEENQEITFRDIAKQVLVRELGLDKPGSAPPPPDPVKAYPGKLLAEKLISKLVQNGHYQVLERSQLQRVLDEHRFNMSGAVDDQQAAEIGKMLGVDALIFGTGAYSVVDGGEWKIFKRKVKEKQKVKGEGDSVAVEKTVVKEIEEEKFQAVRRANVELTYRVVDVRTGVIRASMTNRGGGSSESIKPTAREAVNGLGDWKPLVERGVNTILNTAIRQLAPYQVVQRREIKKGKTQAMKTAMEYAKRGMMDEAKQEWERVLKDGSKKGRKDRVPAMYNLAVYHELAGELNTAEGMFEECFRLSGKSEYLDHKARILARKKEIERLNQQIGE